MKNKTPLIWIAASAFCVLCLAPAAIEAQSQNSGQSVADAARQAREQKKTAQKPVRVITTEDMKPAADAASAAASGPATSSGNANPANDANGDRAAGTETPGQPAPGASDKAAKGQEAQQLADLRRQLAAAQSDLDLAQKQLAFRQETYYSNPDYVHDKTGKAEVDQMAQDVAGKKQTVDQLKAQVDELQQKAGPPPAQTPPSSDSSTAATPPSR